MEPNVFDQMAKQYDTNERVGLANRIREKILPHFGNDPEQDFLDFGCGTGLLGLELAAQCKQVLLYDASDTMLQVVEGKINQRNITNAKTISLSGLKSPDFLGVDLILVSLVLLHIPNTQSILEELFGYLKPNGRLFLIDFDETNLVSHPKVHSGFNQNVLATTLEKVGFAKIDIQTILFEKKVFMNEDASLFLCIAGKGD
ncbi:class I SAM-dependent methyltransferase [Leptospira sp. 96542]|nr:class I SAM-dependent methyltransferase [Leptospira sp. 96542]